MRPSLKSASLAAKICALIANGKSLRSVCRSKSMPDLATVMRWLAADEAFREQYVRAREAQMECVTDEMLDLADSAQGKSAAEVQALRLAVDTRKWIASKLRPRKYGEQGDQGPIALALPEDMRSAAGISAAAEAIIRAACAGEMTMAQAQALSGILDTRRRAIETEDLERRLADLEAAAKSR